jgi:hypothetical protein
LESAGLINRSFGVGKSNPDGRRPRAFAGAG